MITFSIVYCLFCSVMWRLRGGAWSTFLGIHMGTTVTRFVSMFFISLPLAWWFSNPWIIPVVVFGLWFGLVLAGYGRFMGMGDHAHVPPPTWLYFFPRLFGLKPYGVAWDFAGMWFCGVILYGWVTLAAVLASGNCWLLLLIPASGTAFALSYLLMSWIPDAKFPVIKGFTAQVHEEFGELCAGLWTGALLILCALG